MGFGIGFPELLSFVILQKTNGEPKTLCSHDPETTVQDLEKTVPNHQFFDTK